jgi:acetyl-CoA C-acetyltransferase
VADVVITSAARTVIGSHGKSLAAVPPSDLGAAAATTAIERADVEPSDVDHVVFGNVIHTAG